jgi:hypothetical protein
VAHSITVTGCGEDNVEVTKGQEKVDVASLANADSKPQAAIPNGIEGLKAGFAAHSITVTGCGEDNVEVTKGLEEVDVASPADADSIPKAAIPNGCNDPNYLGHHSEHHSQPPN